VSQGNEPRQGGVAIVLSGAGARGAYEAGALSVLLPLLQGDDRPRMVLGASAGALNAAMLAAHIEEGVEAAAAALLAGWRSLSPAMVFATPRKSLLRSFRRRPAGVAAGLLDTGPLRETLGLLLRDEHFAAVVERGALDAVALSASSTSRGGAVVFVETTRAVPSSSGGTGYVATRLGFDHLMASSAFPLAFPAQWVDGEGKGWYIDGGVHLNTPIQPAVKLGADRLLVIGATPACIALEPDPARPPNVMDGSAQILRTLLFDSFRSDLDELVRTNREMGAGATSAAGTSASGTASGPGVVRYCPLYPSDDGLSRVAAQVWPSGLLPFLRSLGGYGALGKITSQRQFPGQFLSYLCFAPEFIAAAISSGISDAERLVNGAARLPWRTGPVSGAP
jgi:NTE family protein